MILTDTPTMQDKANRLLALYARAADNRDFDRLRELFAPDAKLTAGGTTHEGREACIVFFRQTINPSARSQHAVSNVITEPERDGLIRVSSYVRALVLLDSHTRLVAARYEDTVREDDGRLLIVHKRVLIEGVVELPAAQTPAV